MPCGAEIHRSKTFVRNVQNVCWFRKFFVVFSGVDKCTPVRYNVTKFKRRYKNDCFFYCYVLLLHEYQCSGWYLCAPCSNSGHCHIGSVHSNYADLCFAHLRVTAFFGIIKRLCASQPLLYMIYCY